MATSVLETISNEFAAAAERAGGSVVAVHARRWMPTSGIEWKKGVIVTADHGVRRDEDVKVLLAGGQVAAAKLAGRDPSTDLAVLRVNGGEGEGTAGEPKFGDSTSLKTWTPGSGAWAHTARRSGRKQRNHWGHQRRVEKLARRTTRPAHPARPGAVPGIFRRAASEC